MRTWGEDTAQGTLPTRGCPKGVTTEVTTGHPKLTPSPLSLGAKGSLRAGSSPRAHPEKQSVRSKGPRGTRGGLPTRAIRPPQDQPVSSMPLKKIWSEKSENRAYLPPSFSPIENTVYCITIYSRWHTGLVRVGGMGTVEGQLPPGSAPAPGPSSGARPGPDPPSPATRCPVAATRGAQGCPPNPGQDGRKDTRTAQPWGLPGKEGGLWGVRVMDPAVTPAVGRAAVAGELQAGRCGQAGGAGHGPRGGQGCRTLCRKEEHCWPGEHLLLTQ